jgi:AraC-like DNA-binding protein
MQALRFNLVFNCLVVIMEPTVSIPFSITTGSLLGFTKSSDVWCPSGEMHLYIQRIRCFRLDELPHCSFVSNQPEWWIASEGAGFWVANCANEWYSESLLMGAQTFRNETLIHPVFSRSNAKGCVVTFTFKGVRDLLGMKPSLLKNKVLQSQSLGCLSRFKDIKSCLGMTDDQKCLSHISQLFKSLDNIAQRDENHSARQMYDVLQGIDVNETVKSLCFKANVSYRTLNRFFSEHIGVSPKCYLQMNRLHAVCDHLALHPEGEWSEVIEQFGFYDQSHLIREFKRQFGITPNEFRILQRQLFATQVQN